MAVVGRRGGQISSTPTCPSESSTYSTHCASNDPSEDNSSPSYAILPLHSPWKVPCGEDNCHADTQHGQDACISLAEEDENALISAHEGMLGRK